MPGLYKTQDKASDKEMVSVKMDSLWRKSKWKSSAAHETIKLVSELADEETGIISKIFRLTIEPCDPQFFHFLATLCDTERFLNVRCNKYNGAASIDEETALARTIGESVERYCSGIYDEEEMIYSSFNELRQRATDPDLFALYSSTQYLDQGFRCVPFARSTRVRWTQGFSLTAGRETLVPASFVYVPYRFPSEEEFTNLPISTGLACGNTFEQAVVSGVYEVVERDAFMITWLARLQMPKMDIDSVRNLRAKIAAEKFSAVGIEINAINITTDIGIPVVCTVAVDRTGKGPAATVATACDLDLEAALAKSIEEVAHTRYWVKQNLKKSPNPNLLRGFDDVKSNADHPILYGSPRMLGELAFLKDSGLSANGYENNSPKSLKGRILQCVSLLDKAGLEVIVVDLTTPDIKEVGLHVVRVIVPGAHPLSIGHKSRCLGGRRLYSVPKKLGMEKSITEMDLNPAPHPLP